MAKTHPTRRRWLASAGAAGLAGAASGVFARQTKARLPGAEPLGPLARRLLGASDKQLAVLEEGRRRGLIEIAPVNLPGAPPSDCNHYCWPIAT